MPCYRNKSNFFTLFHVLHTVYFKIELQITGKCLYAVRPESGLRSRIMFPHRINLCNNIKVYFNYNNYAKPNLMSWQSVNVGIYQQYVIRFPNLDNVSLWRVIFLTFYSQLLSVFLPFVYIWLIYKIRLERY